MPSVGLSETLTGKYEFMMSGGGRIGVRSLDSNASGGGYIAFCAVVEGEPFISNISFIVELTVYNTGWVMGVHFLATRGLTKCWLG